MCSCSGSMQHFKNLTWDLRMGISDAKKPRSSVAIWIPPITDPPLHPSPPPTATVALLHCQRKRDIPAWLHAGVTDNRARERPRLAVPSDKLSADDSVSREWRRCARCSWEAPVAAALTKRSPGNPPRLRPRCCQHHVRTSTCSWVLCLFEKQKTKTNLKLKLCVNKVEIIGIKSTHIRWILQKTGVSNNVHLKQNCSTAFAPKAFQLYTQHYEWLHVDMNCIILNLFTKFFSFLRELYSQNFDFTMFSNCKLVNKRNRSSCCGLYPLLQISKHT